MGLSGNVLVKSHISKSKFDVFDIREDFSLNDYTKYEEIPFAGFFNTTIMG